MKLGVEGLSRKQSLVNSLPVGWNSKGLSPQKRGESEVDGSSPGIRPRFKSSHLYHHLISG